MNPRVRALVRRDLRALSRSRGVLAPLLAVPAVLLALFPAMVGVAPTTVGLPPSLVQELRRLSLGMPEAVQAGLVGLSDEQAAVSLILLHFMAPLYLVVPLMVASVIAADAFAGERERGTLEALAHTPTTDRELFLAKVLTAWIPAVAVGLGSLVVYGASVNLGARAVMGGWIFPTPAWLALGLWVGPAVAALGLSLNVHISARVRTVQEASQLGSVVVVPLVMLVVAQVSGRLALDLPRALGLGALLWGLAGALLLLAARTCRREVLMGRTSEM